MSDATSQSPQPAAEAGLDQHLVARAYRKVMNREELTAGAPRRQKTREKDPESGCKWLGLTLKAPAL
jgi:hypothetical protein